MWYISVVGGSECAGRSTSSSSSPSKKRASRSTEWIVSPDKIPWHQGRTPVRRRLFNPRVSSSIKNMKRKTRMQNQMRATVSCYRRKLWKAKNTQPKISLRDVLQFCAGKISPVALEFLKHQLTNHKKIRWSKNVKESSLCFYFTGPRLYRLLRNIFKLPSISCLRSYITDIVINPGCCSGIFSQLKCKASSMAHEDRKCILLMDEMSLKTNLTYDKKSDKVVGIVDFGDGDRAAARANSVTVLMLRGIRKAWKQAIAYVFTNNAIPHQKVSEILTKVLKRTTAAGFHVVGITTDQGATFVKAFKDMGCTPQQPTITISGLKLVILPDVPHLLKSTRNILHNGNII